VTGSSVNRQSYDETSGTGESAGEGFRTAGAQPQATRRVASQKQAGERD
jgi:hypothetical protein